MLSTSPKPTAPDAHFGLEGLALRIFSHQDAHVGRDYRLDQAGLFVNVVAERVAGKTFAVEDIKGFTVNVLASNPAAINDGGLRDLLSPHQGLDGKLSLQFWIDKGGAVFADKQTTTPDPKLTEIAEKILTLIDASSRT